MLELMSSYRFDKEIEYARSILREKFVELH